MDSKRFCSLCLLALLLFTAAEAKRTIYYASICAIFKDEAPYLKEWIEYHLLLGFEHFYLYNNQSSDNYKAVLEPYIKHGAVELTEWDQPYATDFDPVQKGAYNDCIERCKEKTRWLALIDIDEFIVPVKVTTIRELLAPFDKQKKCGGLMMSWVFYGTSHQPNIPEGKLLIETLTQRVDLDHFWNQNCKTICKPDKVKYFHVHEAKYLPGYHGVNSNHKSGAPIPPVFDKVRVNHYWTRAEDFFYNVKAPRRAKFTGHLWTQPEMDEIIEISNRNEDKIIFKYVPKLRKRMFSSSGADSVSMPRLRSERSLPPAAS